MTELEAAATGAGRELLEAASAKLDVYLKVQDETVRNAKLNSSSRAYQLWNSETQPLVRVVSKAADALSDSIAKPDASTEQLRAAIAFGRAREGWLRLSRSTPNGDASIETVVQPDICVVCDPAKLDERGCLGAPDWIIEIVSPGTAARDTKDKFDLYEEAGVQEYWIVDVEHETVAGAPDVVRDVRMAANQQDVVVAEPIPCPVQVEHHRDLVLAVAVVLVVTPRRCVQDYFFI